MSWLVRFSLGTRTIFLIKLKDEHSFIQWQSSGSWQLHLHYKEVRQTDPAGWDRHCTPPCSVRCPAYDGDQVSSDGVAWSSTPVLGPSKGTTGSANTSWVRSLPVPSNKGQQCSPFRPQARSVCLSANSATMSALVREGAGGTCWKRVFS